jgi:hypothetical protein
MRLKSPSQTLIVLVGLCERSLADKIELIDTPGVNESTALNLRCVHHCKCFIASWGDRGAGMWCVMS